MLIRIDILCVRHTIEGHKEATIQSGDHSLINTSSESVAQKYRRTRDFER